MSPRFVTYFSGAKLFPFENHCLRIFCKQPIPSVSTVFCSRHHPFSTVDCSYSLPVALPSVHPETGFHLWSFRNKGGRLASAQPNPVTELFPTSLIFGSIVILRHSVESCCICLGQLDLFSVLSMWKHAVLGPLLSSLSHFPSPLLCFMATSVWIITKQRSCPLDKLQAYIWSCLLNMSAKNLYDMWSWIFLHMQKSSFFSFLLLLIPMNGTTVFYILVFQMFLLSITSVETLWKCYI